MPCASILSAAYFDSVSNQPTCPDCMSEPLACQARTPFHWPVALFPAVASDEGKARRASWIQPRGKPGWFVAEATLSNRRRFRRQRPRKPRLGAWVWVPPSTPADEPAPDIGESGGDFRYVRVT